MRLPIIMPNYNKALYLKEALDSVFSQTYKNIVVYFYDDGSTDDSVEIVCNYKRVKKVDIKIIKGTKNKGVAHAVNRLKKDVEKDGYDYFYIMASDDTIEETLIQKLVSMIDDEHGFYTCNAQMYGLEDRLFESEPNLTIDSFRNRSPLLTTGIYSVKMWSDLGGRKEDWKLTHDYEFFLRMFIAGYKHKVLNEPLYLWRNYEEQLSRQPADNRWTMEKAFEINNLTY